MSDNLPPTDKNFIIIIPAGFNNSNDSNSSESGSDFNFSNNNDNNSNSNGTSSDECVPEYTQEELEIIQYLSDNDLILIEVSIDMINSSSFTKQFEFSQETELNKMIISILYSLDVNEIKDLCKLTCVQLYSTSSDDNFMEELKEHGGEFIFNSDNDHNCEFNFNTKLKEFVLELKDN